MNISQKCIDLIKQFEGCRLEAYQDIQGKWTIGYGSTTNVHDGLVITQDQAEQILLDDLNNNARWVATLLRVDLNQCQMDALTSLCFNVGIGRLRESKTLKLINNGQDPTQEWLGFCFAAGVEIEGLLRRRKAELALYFTV